MPVSIRLTNEASAALSFLRTRTGGFNLNGTTCQVIIDAAIKEGWCRECLQFPCSCDSEYEKYRERERQ